MMKQIKIILKKKQSTQKVQSAVKHLNPCFLTTSVNEKQQQWLKGTFL